MLAEINSYQDNVSRLEPIEKSVYVFHKTHIIQDKHQIFVLISYSEFH